MLRSFLLICALLAPALGEPVRVLGLEFQPSLPLSSPEKLGESACALVAPADSSRGAESLEVVLHLSSPSGEAKGDPFQEEKKAYLGLTKPAPEHRTRTILGQSVTGDYYPHAVGGRAVECYWVRLPDKRWLLLAVRKASFADPQKADQLMESICSTLQVLPMNQY